MDWVNRLENVQNKIKLQLHSKKIDNLESLYRLMAQVDIDNSGYLNKDEFQNLLSKLGLFLTTQELRALYDVYDTNHDENIAYTEFVQMIRTSISQKRLAVVKHAFNFLDKRNNGTLLLSELTRQYRSEVHPRVLARHKTSQQVLEEFVNTITKKSQDGKTINENEFLEYYADINATLPQEKEEYFIDIVLNTWGITSSVNYVPPERLADLEIILYEKIRQKTFTKEDEGKTLLRAFKYFDLSGKGVIDIAQFKQTLDKFGCVFTEKEVQALFNKFDSNHSGKICYDEFSGIFASLGSEGNPNVTSTFSQSREPPKVLITKLNTELKKKGVFAFRSLSRACKKADSFLNGNLSLPEFQWVVKEVGFTLTKNEFENLFKYFDKNVDGQVAYASFIDLVRGPQSQQVTDALNSIYDRFEGAATNDVKIATFLANYNPNAIQVLAPTRRSLQDIKQEFVSQCAGVQQLCREEFLQFFTDIRASAENENKFLQYLSVAFGQ